MSERNLNNMDEGSKYDEGKSGESPKILPPPPRGTRPTRHSSVAAVRAKLASGSGVPPPNKPKPSGAAGSSTAAYRRMLMQKRSAAAQNSNGQSPVSIIPPPSGPRPTRGGAVDEGKRSERSEWWICLEHIQTILKMMRQEHPKHDFLTVLR